MLRRYFGVTVMRVYPATGIIVACIALSACANPATETRAVERINVPQVGSPLADIPNKTPGQPRLSELRGRSAQAESPSREEPRPPAATFSRYDGRAPSDAIVARSIPVSKSVPRGEDRQRSALSNQESLALAFAKPKPDAPVKPTVQKRKTAPVIYKSPPARLPEEAVSAPVQQASRSVTTTPRPQRRPITASPRPTRRPTVEVATVAPAAVIPVETPPVAALPTPPSIRALALPSLNAPRTSQDSTPTALPEPLTAEVAIPLGTIPASLGVANIQAAEAALPVADSLEQSKADSSGTLGWDDAMALVRAGEVDSAIDVGEFEVLMTLCSGRGVLTIQPTPGALDAINFPKVVCGKAASLTSQ